MKRFAVIGHPIGHSLSPDIHELFAKQCSIDLQYTRQDILPEKCLAWIEKFFAEDGAGLNVTVPHKEIVLESADVIHERAQKAKAANTLWKQHNKIHADNTDGVGLIRDLQRYIPLEGKTVLILGAGGAARGIIDPLLETNIQSLAIANRNAERAQLLQSQYPSLKYIPWSEIGGTIDLLINATSAALNDASLPLQPKNFSQPPFVYDLNYRLDSNTPFIRQCRTFGWHGVDGLGMLVEQAAESFYIWHGVRPDSKKVLQYLRSYR